MSRTFKAEHYKRPRGYKEYTKEFNIPVSAINDLIILYANCVAFARKYEHSYINLVTSYYRVVAYVVYAVPPTPAQIAASKKLAEARRATAAKRAEARKLRDEKKRLAEEAKERAQYEKLKAKFEPKDSEVLGVEEAS